MRINLAKVLPALFYLGLAGVYLLFTVSTAEPESDYGGGYYGSRGTTQADRYLDRVAVELARPGLYVDPTVDLDAAAAAELDERAAATDGPVRIAVVPAEELYYDGADTAGSFVDGADLIAYQEIELPAQVYDRVGVDGTYAVLVDASSSDGGRSFFAGQWAEVGPSYAVEDAAEDAIACCAPGYEDMLDAFVDEAGDRRIAWGTVVPLGLGGLVAVFLLHRLVLRRLLAARRERRESAGLVADLRGPLDEEVVDVSRTVSALPTPGGGDDALDRRVRTVLDLVEQARHQLDEMDTEREATAVVERLGDARYELTVIEALRAGREVPRRTPPCFVDPRHGPGRTERVFTPEGGETRTVVVCAACAESLDAGNTVQPRTLRVGGATRFYWDAGPTSRVYLNGYWRRDRFPVRTAERSRQRAIVTSRTFDSDDGWRGVQFVWEPSKNTGRSSGGRSRGFSSAGGGGGSRSSLRGGGGGRF